MANNPVFSPLAIVWPALLGGFSCFFFISYLYKKLMSEGRTGSQIGQPKLDRLAAQIKSGSIAFLKEEYRVLAMFVCAAAFILFLTFTFQSSFGVGIRVGFCFLTGAFLSALSGWLGMRVATDGNVRTTVACTEGSLNDGLVIAFTSGAIMGFSVVGLGLSGLTVIFLLIATTNDLTTVCQELTGFGFGASSIALFARVAGGIYTKAADVGADLVGKVESGIDEDDPHNPAVIADNVGDNVGDVAGMGADLFESYVGSIIAAATLASLEGSNDEYQMSKVALPFYLSGLGIFASMAGYFFVRTEEEGGGWNVNLSSLMWALEKGMYAAAAIFLSSSFFLTFLMGFPFLLSFQLFLCISLGLVGGVVIGKSTEYFTSFDFGPVKSITDRGSTGPATVVIQGLGVGMISCVPPCIVLVMVILLCSSLGGLYGVSISAVGMLSTLGITLATDAYGPVADNAGGLAEMGNLGPDVRAKTDALDALGNTTAATGKGFAIGSAVLTALSLLAAFQTIVDPQMTMSFSVGDPIILSGLLIGSMLTFLFAALTMISVGKAAAEIINEVRRQFNEIPGLRNAIEMASRGEEIPEHLDVQPDSDRCVAISTKSSLKEMLAPGAYAILSPLIIGLFVGPRCLMGVLAGSISTGCVLAIMMSNAGGAWDNSKKLCEKLNIKKTDQGKACIVGDTVGDPFKDTSGPALNILIKLMSMISLTIAPLIKGKKDFEGWMVGVLPIVVFGWVTHYLVKTKILSWEDPLGGHLGNSGKGANMKSNSPNSPGTEEEKRISNQNTVNDTTTLKPNQVNNQGMENVVGNITHNVNGFISGNVASGVSINNITGATTFELEDAGTGPISVGRAGV